MDLLQAIALGLIQGITEWLPISSQGQTMAFALAFFGLSPEKAFQYAVFLHIGTLIASAVYFRKEIREILLLKEKEKGRFIGIALLGTAITAIPSYFFLRHMLSNPVLILLLIGLFLLITGFFQQIKRKKVEARLSGLNAVLLGLAQGFSVLPGISRSGITTAVLLFEGFSPEKAFRLSFLLSVPAVLLGETAFAFLQPIAFEPNILAALIVAFITGLASIHFLLKIARRIRFSYFCFLLGALYISLAVL